MRYEKQVKYIVACLIVALVAPRLGTLYGRWLRGDFNQTTTMASSPEITTNVMRQNGEGTTDQTYSEELLKYQEKVLEQTFIEEGRKGFVASGGAPNLWNPKTTSSSTFAEIEGHKYGVIKLTAEITPSDVAQVLRIIGFQGPTVVSVCCMRKVAERISLTSGSCAEKVKEVFGVVLGER